MSDISLLRSFLAVYRAGSVTGGAGAVHLSQPAVTAHVNSLETYVGEPLFARTPRGTEPTRAGHELARRCEQQLDALEELLGALAADEPISPDVWVGGPSQLMGDWLLPRLLPKLDPGVRLRSWFSDNDSVLEGLMSGTLDIAVLTDTPHHPSIATEQFGEETLRLVGAPSIAAALPKLRVGASGAKQLSGTPVVAFDEGLPLIDEYWHAVFRTEPSAEPDHTVAGLRAVALLVAAGAGISVLPDHVCRPFLDSGELVTLLDPPTAPRKGLHIGWRAGQIRRRSDAHVRERMLSLAGSWK